MRRFALRRAVEPSTTRQEVDANAMQMLVVLSSGLSRRDLDDWNEREITEPVSWLDVSWVRTYWHAGGDAGMCLYAGPTQGAVQDANLSCGFPYEEIQEVVELTAPGRTDPVTRHASPRLPGARLFWVECTLRPGVKPDAALWSSLPGALRAAGVDPVPAYLEGGAPAEWVRTYWREDTRWFLGLYAVADCTWLQTVPVSGLRHGRAIVRPVVEIAPADYMG